MADFTLVLGSKSLSSWSLRGWLVAKATGASFEEIVIPLDRPGTAAAIRAHSPAGRVPILTRGELTVWDSLAIAETLAEWYPAARLWPENPALRARARAVVAEMHAGFAALRAALPFDAALEHAGTAVNVAARADLDRICAIWRQCLAAKPGAGPYLYGDFSIADAFYAPVVLRLVQHGVAPEPGAPADYAAAIRDRADVVRWLAEARRERAQAGRIAVNP